ncbi:hypothetical protein H6F90_20145 [Trichocoleus sp. FACHB-591]|uniref:hypothetical protein n=1 Tax=Trichocoleus sp. FACHB-591 TaxID=2692872 RepID=UPI00168670FB|nr:hypothetical protein [Trichocoleus sp. FACHB-591]MBD2097413.1 hypothetical protein [Trichocoleus sp. FACHB-591]
MHSSETAQTQVLLSPVMMLLLEWNRGSGAYPIHDGGDRSFTFDRAIAFAKAATTSQR